MSLLCLGCDIARIAAIAAAIMASWHRGERFPDFMERDLELGNPDTGPARLYKLGADPARKFS